MYLQVSLRLGLACQPGSRLLARCGTLYQPTRSNNGVAGCIPKSLYFPAVRFDPVVQFGHYSILVITIAYPIAIATAYLNNTVGRQT